MNVSRALCRELGEWLDKNGLTRLSVDDALDALLATKKDKAEQAARASMLSLLDSPRAGMQIVLKSGETLYIDGRTFMNGVTEYQVRGYRRYKKMLPILRELVRGGATVRLPEEAR